MARYINADKLRNEIKDLPEQERIELMGIYDVIRNQPPADVQEVKHGKWIDKGNETVICSECKFLDVYTDEYGEGTLDEYKSENQFCRNCGAKMDGKD